MQEKIIGFAIDKALPCLAVIIIGAILVKAVLGLVKKLLSKSTNVIDPMLHKIILTVCKICLWLVVLLTAMNQLGISTSSVLTVFAAAGAAIALGLQGSLSNVASGIIIMFTKPFKHGDYIICAGMEGTVEAIDLLATTIVTVDNKVINIPNGTLTSNAITNASKKSTRRIDVKIGVAYDSDLDKARGAILDMAKADGRFLNDPAIFCAVASYDNSAIVLQFRGWVNTADYWNVWFNFHNQIKPTLDAAGISIPFDQVDVHISQQ